MKKERIQAAKPVQAAIMALDTAIRTEAERLGVDAKTIVIGIHRDDDTTEIALAGCTCGVCAANLTRALMNHMHDDQADVAPDEEFGETADAAGLVH